MELWIRSQDRKYLARAGMINIASDGRTIVDDLPKFHYLGTYKTKERALEILDEIQNILKPKILLRRNDDNDKELLGALQKGVTQKMDIDFKELPTYVYEMPKE